MSRRLVQIRRFATHFESLEIQKQILAAQQETNRTLQNIERHLYVIKMNTTRSMVHDGSDLLVRCEDIYDLKRGKPNSDYVRGTYRI